MRLDFLTVEIKSRVTVLDTPIFDTNDLLCTNSCIWPMRLIA